VFFRFIEGRALEAWLRILEVWQKVLKAWLRALEAFGCIGLHG